MEIQIKVTQCETSQHIAPQLLDNVLLSSAADWLVVGKRGGEATSTTGNGSQCCGVALGWEGEGDWYGGYGLCMEAGMGVLPQKAAVQFHLANKIWLTHTIREARGARATMTLLSSPA